MDPLNSYLKGNLPELERTTFGVPAIPPQLETLAWVKDLSDTRPIDQRQFALMFGDTFIKGAPLEGGNALDNAQYYLQEIDLIPNLSAEQRESIKRDIKCFIAAGKLIGQGDVAALKAFINTQLEQNGRVVIPINISGRGKDFSGHVLSCVFEKTKDGISYYFLNKGDGSGKHPQVKLSALGKEYISYRSLTHVIKNPDYFAGKSSADIMLKRIINYNKTPPVEALPLYHSNFFYDDMEIFADEVLPPSGVPDDNIGVGTQRSGTCPEQALRLIIRDNLLKQGSDLTVVRHTMFETKMRGLKNAYHHLPLDNAVNISLARKAAESFATQTARMYRRGVITDKDEQKALVLIEEMRKKADLAEANLVQPINLGDFEDLKVNRKIELTWEALAAERKGEKLEAPKSPTPLNLNTERYARYNGDKLLRECLDDPNKIVDALDKLQGSELETFVLHLPMPKQGDDPYWSRVRPENIHKIIAKMSVQAKSLADPKFKQPLVELPVKMMCAICHRLLLNDPEIGKYLEEYKVELSKENDSNFYYSDGRLQVLEDEVHAYFDKPGKRIFDGHFPKISPVLLEYTKEFLHGTGWRGHFLPTLQVYQAIISTLKIKPEDLGLKPDDHVEMYIKLMSEGMPSNEKANSVHLLHEISNIIFKTTFFPGITKKRTNSDDKEEENQLIPDIISKAEVIENEGVLFAVNTKYEMNKEAYESLKRVSFFETSVIPRFIDWCHSHPELMHLKDVQDFLEMTLLKGSCIRSADARTIGELKRFMNERLDAVQNNPNEFMYWAKLIAHVETRLGGDVKPLIEKVKTNYRKCMSTDMQAAEKIATCCYYIYSLFPELLTQSPENYLDFNEDFLLFAVNGIDSKITEPWILASIRRFDAKLYQSLRVVKQQKLPKISKYLNLSPDIKWDMEYPYAQYGDYKIHLDWGELYYKDKEITKNLPAKLRLFFKKKKDLLTPFEQFVFNLYQKEKSYIITDKTMEAPDGSFILQVGEVPQVICTFEINGVKEKFYTNSDLIFQDKELTKNIGAGSRIKWVSVNDPDRFLSLDKDSKPRFLVTRKYIKYTMKKIDDKGNTTGEYVAHYDENSAFARDLRKIVPAEKITLFCKKKKVSSIKLGELSFTVEKGQNGSVRFKCEDMPGYYLSKDQWLGGLLGKGAIWLEDAKGVNKKAVIGSSRFKLDLRTGKLDPESNLSRLHLISHYLDMGRYQESFELVKDLDFSRVPDGENEKELFKNFLTDILKHKDTSPGATALKIHVYNYFSNIKDIQNIGGDDRAQLFNGKFLAELLNRYKKFTGSSEFQRIPEPLRLDPAVLNLDTYAYGQKMLLNEEDIEIKKRLKELLDLKKYKLQNWNSVYQYREPHMLDDESFRSSTVTSELGPFAVGASDFVSYIRRCETEDYPGQIDLDIYSSDRSTRLNSFPKNKNKPLYALLWLYRKTKDLALKEYLEGFYGRHRPGVSDYKRLIERAEELYKTLPPEKTLAEINIQAPKIATVVKSESPKTKLPPEKDVRASPFHGIADGCWKKEMKPCFEQGLQHFLNGLPVSDNIAKKFVGELSSAHTENLKEEYAVYEKGENAEQLKTIAEQKSRELLKQAKARLEQIEKLANSPHEMKSGLVDYRIKQQAQQKMKLTFRDPLLQALLTRNMDVIKERNPFLNDEQILELQKMMLEYIDLMNQKTQVDAVAAEKSFSKAAALADHERKYDLYQYPELAIYEYATGFQLRPEQVKLLKNIIVATIEKDQDRLRQLCFEFQAGGGKTKVISVILAARFQAEGKVPVFFSVPHLEDVTREDLKDSLNKVFERKLSMIHYSITDKIGKEEIKKVHQTFVKAAKEKRTVFMTPETWHALNLARIEAIRKADMDVLLEIDSLFNFMKENCVALIDEGHLNADALHETNRATGEFLHIPPRERKLFVTFVRHLMEDEDVKLGENAQANMLSKKLPEVKRRMAVQMAKEFKKDVSEDKMGELIDYWMKPDAPRPEWMKGDDEHNILLLNRIDLVRGLLNVVMPFALQKTRELDYQPPKDASTEVWIPAKQGIASNAHFQDTDVAAFVSCVGTFQRGLTEVQFEKAVGTFVTSYQDANRRGAAKEDKYQRQWNKLNLGISLSEFISLDADSKIAFLKKSHPAAKNNILLITQYLQDEILSRVTIYSTIEQSTSTNLIEAFFTSIMFSATMGIHEKYPVKSDPKESHIRDMKFMDQVMTRATLPHQSKMNWMAETKPIDALKALSNFEEIEGVINVGSFCENSSNEEWADAFLKLAKERGLDKKAALFFRVNEKGERSLYLNILKEPPEYHNISGSNLKVIFESLGLKNEQVYKIFAPAETTGTDFPISPEARMIVTVGEHVNLSLAVQSIMRMRGFLNNPVEPGQKITWLGTNDFKNKLEERFPDTEISPNHFLGYALEKEAETDKAAIKQQAIQEIEAVIIREVEEKAPELRKDIYNRSFERDPSASYGGSNEEIATFDYLQAHARNFAPNDAILQGVQNKINVIAERASTLVEKCHQRTQNNLSATMQQHVQMQQKQEQKMEQKAEADFRHAYQANYEKNYDQPLFGKPIQETFKDNIHHSGGFFSDDLFFFDNVSSENQIFSPDVLVVTRSIHGKIDVYRNKKRIGEYEIKRSEEQKGMGGFVALFSHTGQLIAKSKDFPEDDFITINEEGWLQTKIKEKFPPEVLTANKNFIRNVDMFLVEEIDGVKRAFVLSGNDADKFIAQMHGRVNANKKIAIFTAKGTLVKNGPPGAGFSDRELDLLKDDPWMVNKINEIHFWNGQIYDKKWMEQKLETDRKRCVETWVDLTGRHFNQAHVQYKAMQELMAEKAPVGVVSEEVVAQDQIEIREYPKRNRA